MDVLGWGKRGDWWREVFIGEPLKPVSRGSEFGALWSLRLGISGRSGLGTTLILLWRSSGITPVTAFRGLILFLPVRGAAL